MLRNLPAEITLGVVADSHVPERMARIPETALLCFRQEQVSAILHAGDMTHPRVLHQFEQIAPVIAVRGNRDIWTSSGRRLPLHQVMVFGGVRIGLTHGHGGLWDYLWEKVLYYTVGFSLARYMHRLPMKFPYDVRVIVFGHIHRTVNKWVGDTLLFSPGSLGPKYYSPVGAVVGLLRICNGRVAAEVVPVDA